MKSADSVNHYDFSYLRSLKTVRKIVSYTSEETIERKEEMLDQTVDRGRRGRGQVGRKPGRPGARGLSLIQVWQLQCQLSTIVQ